MGVTIQQLAELAGVSRGTVDRVINQRGRVDKEVAKRVMDIAMQQGYQQKPRKKGKQFKIGVITQLGEASFMQEIQKGILKAKVELEEKGTQVLIRQSEDIDEMKQLAYIDELVEENIDALAIMPVDCESIRHKLNDLIEKRKIPVVTFNSDIVGTKRNCFIGMDNRKSGIAAAGLLGLLMRGEGRILIITGHFTNRANSLRVEGFIEQMHKSYPNIVLLGVQSSLDKEEQVEKIVSQAMHDYPDLAGIFMASAGQEGIYKALKKQAMKQRPYVIAYDVTEHNTKRLKRGDFDFLIDQESERQGYEAPIMLYRILKKEAVQQDHVYMNIQLKTPFTI